MYSTKTVPLVQKSIKPKIRDDIIKCIVWGVFFSKEDAAPIRNDKFASKTQSISMPCRTLSLSLSLTHSHMTQPRVHRHTNSHKMNEKYTPNQRNTTAIEGASVSRLYKKLWRNIKKWISFYWAQDNGVLCAWRACRCQLDRFVQYANVWIHKRKVRCVCPQIWQNPHI